MQIKLDLKILIFLLIFHFTGQIKIYILLMIFACIHELGHLVIALFLGVKPTQIQIKPIGYSVEFCYQINDYNKKIKKGSLAEVKKIIIYMAGPAINIIIAGIIFSCNGNISMREELIYANLIIAFVNLIPIYPLDGGRIIKCLLCILCGLDNTYKYSERISWILMIIILASSSILVLKVKNYALTIMVLYLFYIRIINSKAIERKLKLYANLKTSKT